MIMKKYFLIVALLAPLMSVTAIAGCVADVPPKLPDGNTVTEDEMRESVRAIRSYITKNEAYLACLDKDKRSGHWKTNTKHYNAMVDEMKRVGASFNTELKLFKLRQ